MVRCPEDATEVPDYKIYKVEDCPRLVELERALDRKGLKDPWIRNEVWRFKEFGTERSRAFNFFFRGLKIGFFAFVMTIMMEHVATRHSEIRNRGKPKTKKECDEDRK